MSYVGNTPTQQAFTPAVDYFSGNGSTTAFTLSRPVASVSQVFVVVNNVDQNPSTAYTVSSNTITFTGAPSTGTNNIYVRYTSPITQVIQPGQGTVGNTQMATGAALANIGAGGLAQSYLAANVASTGPAFSAYPSGSQSITASTWTKLQYNTEEFDTNSNYDNATNYRFTPTVAGYYSFTAAILVSTTTTRSLFSFYKNGAVFKSFDTNYGINSAGGSALIYLNGSTDYVELYAFLVGVAPSLAAGPTYAFFQASMVRAA